MNKFLDWFYKNRKTIGYTIGGLNLLAAVNYAVNGDYGLAIMWAVISVFLIVDAHEFK